jgi:hypothetical protein
MLPAIDLYEDFIDVEGVAVSTMSSFQSPGIFGTKLDTPQTDGFIADGDTPLGKEIFDIAMAEIESIVQPDCVADDIGRESVTLVGIRRPILPISAG